WHFADRQALLDEMLDTWERATTEGAIERLESEGGAAAAKLRRLFSLASRTVLMTDLAVRNWSRHDPAVAERPRRVDNRRMEYLPSLFGALCADADDAEARSMLAFSLLIGDHFIAADHGGLSRADVLELALRRLAAQPAARGAGPIAPFFSSCEGGCGVGGILGSPGRPDRGRGGPASRRWACPGGRVER